MLVIRLNRNEAATLYAKDGKKLGEIKMMDIRGDGVHVGFQFSKNEVAIARPGVTAEEALSLCNRIKNPDNH